VAVAVEDDMAPVVDSLLLLPLPLPLDGGKDPLPLPLDGGEDPLLVSTWNLHRLSSRTA
jgi:hypothetical protein